jgi:hypothetical protein
LLSFVSLSHKLVCSQHGNLDFDYFLRAGMIEYLDVNEENNALVHHDSFTSLWFVIQIVLVCTNMIQTDCIV